MDTASAPAVVDDVGRSEFDATPLGRGAVLTALAAVLFPRLNAVLHEGQAFWQLDHEAALLIPLIIAVTLALFALAGRWAWRDARVRNRPATVGLAAAILAILGVVAFWVSAPIMLGGVAVTLGIEGRHRSVAAGKSRRAVTAIALGALAVTAGAAIWLIGV